MLAVLTVGLAAAAPGHQTSLGLAVGWHDGPRQVAIGAGPQLAHRLSLGDGPWQLAGAVERLWLVVPAVGLRAEGAWAPRDGAWQPSLGLELATYLGRIRIVSTAHPEPPVWPATALRLRVRPLVWRVGQHTSVSALELAPGLGLDTPSQTLAFGLTPFALAHRW
jgi:hypothetical protein